jgi:hypothetical protein
MIPGAVPNNAGFDGDMPGIPGVPVIALFLFFK